MSYPADCLSYENRMTNAPLNKGHFIASSIYLSYLLILIITIVILKCSCSNAEVHVRHIFKDIDFRVSALLEINNVEN